ncbi:multidrug ABC transporter permease [Paenibacillus antibioticophila]|uniref:Multidrug ABC transporter permease n=1 Tax=Paenibacillus antibioticophila TaxID=1274374 RepID=A0A919XNC5_9BACL|nr:lantibiotic immunity ABC transporter MutE/EpiE family permease subunit [Paenibacillus antibioticophila]GIO35416.1 multidrug ABC transporter permease [Paenibacillus antibioticophila]
MKVYIHAELLKLRRTFTARLVWLAPLLTLLLCAGLMAGSFFQSASYNWWYTMILPGAISLMGIGIIQKDRKKLNYRAILGFPTSLSKVWLGKIGAVSLLLLASSLLLLAGITLSAFVFPFPAALSLKDSLTAASLLVLTFLWQIPLCMFLFMRLGMYGALLLNLLGNVIATVALATTELWWVIPYAIPARLMCPVINTLPNGLPVPAGDPLLEQGVLLPGVLIALGWFLLLSLLTMQAFKRQEAR